MTKVKQSLAVLLLLMPILAHAGITINTVTGFDDNTAVAAVGGNQGLTVGEQRRQVFERAALIWESMLQIDVEVVIDASFSELSCSRFSGVVGSAGPNWVAQDFPGAPLAGTWYAGAHVLQLKGSRDTSPDPQLADPLVDISMDFNSRINGDPNCLNGMEWYYGLDNNASSSQTDLLVIVLHEMAHGLGYLSLVEESGGVSTGALFQDAIDAFTIHIRDLSTGKNWEDMSDEERFVSGENDGNVVWTGAQANSFTSLLSSGTNNGFAQLFAPVDWDSGSSVSHFDQVMTYQAPNGPEELMEPEETGLGTSDFLTLGALVDIGWTGKRDYDGDGIVDGDDPFPLVADPASDTDSDGIPNVSDTDDDNDGMPDSYELANYLNPNDPADAGTDADNDGASNLDEFLGGTNPLLVDQPPVFSGLQPVMTVDAEGVFTNVDFSGVTAVDSNGSSLPYNISPLPPWKSGVNNLVFTTQDAYGNSAAENVQLNIKPLVQLLGPDEAVEGDQLNYRVSLSGSSISALPVNLDYTVSGTATSGVDHDLASGQLLFNGGESSLLVNINTDLFNEIQESLQISFVANANVAVNEDSVLTTAILETGNILHGVDLELSVSSIPATQVSQGSILVVDAVVSDTSATTYSYDWSGSDDVLGVDSANSGQLNINTASLANGVYRLELAVTDLAAPANVARTAINFVIGSTLRADQDKDGVADSVDSEANPQTLMTASTNPQTFLLESAAGLLLRVGEQPLLYNAGGSFMSADFYTADSGRLFPLGVYDLELRQVKQGGSGEFFIPLTAALEDGQMIRVLVDGRWQEIVLDGSNRLMSASSSLNGFCPGLKSIDWALGANTGDNCLKFELLDGGPNDADGQENGIVTIIVGVSSQAPARSSGGGGGSIPMLFLVVLLLVFSRVFSQKLIAIKH